MVKSSYASVCPACGGLVFPASLAGAAVAARTPAPGAATTMKRTASGRFILPSLRSTAQRERFQAPTVRRCRGRRKVGNALLFGGGSGRRRRFPARDGGGAPRPRGESHRRG